jgi:hypothetical protein
MRVDFGSLPEVARVEADTADPKSIGRRFHAARLAARHYEVSPLIRGWESVKDPTYRAAESGLRRPKPELFKLAVTSFNVSRHFLEHGRIIGGLDAEAAAIAALLERFDVLKERHKREGAPRPREDIALRLRRARLAAGHRSAKAAADHFGWKVDRYEQHEGRRRNITFDQAIRYATTFGIDAASLIFGASTTVVALPSDRTEASRIPTGAGWAWLRPTVRPDRVEWPAVMLEAGRFVRLASPVILPLEVVGDAARRQEAYCIVERGNSASIGRIFVVAPGMESGRSMRLMDGRLVAGSPSPNETPTDPLEPRSDLRDANLGALIGTLSLAW